MKLSEWARREGISYLTGVYARVSSHDQRADLGQVARVTEWAASHGLSVDEVVKEVGFGLNCEA